MGVFIENLDSITPPLGGQRLNSSHKNKSKETLISTQKIYICPTPIKNFTICPTDRLHPISANIQRLSTEWTIG